MATRVRRELRPFENITDQPNGDPTIWNSGLGIRFYLRLAQTLNRPAGHCFENEVTGAKDNPHEKQNQEQIDNPIFDLSAHDADSGRRSKE